MRRRKFLGAAVSGAIAVVTATSVRAQAPTPRTVRWRMPSSFPNRSTPSGTKPNSSPTGCASSSMASSTSLPFRPARSYRQCRCWTRCRTAPPNALIRAGFYYLGKEPALVFDIGVPFGLTPCQHNSGLFHGGGLALMRELNAKFGMMQIACGNTGAQMGGWFRKEIKSAAEFKGLRICTPGFLGMVYRKIGASPLQIADGNIYLALKKTHWARSNGSGRTTTKNPASERSPSSNMARAQWNWLRRCASSSTRKPTRPCRSSSRKRFNRPAPKPATTCWPSTMPTTSPR